jgi:hypothetical protein
MWGSHFASSAGSDLIAPMQACVMVIEHWWPLSACAAR